MRLTLAFSPRTSSASSRAWVSESLISRSRTYSKVRRSRLRKGNSRAAISSFSKFHFLFSGMIRVRSSSLGAFNEIASFGRTGSAPRSYIRGTIPAVETVIRDSGTPTPFTSSRTALMKFSKFRNGSPIPMNTKLTRSFGGVTFWSRNTAITWPTISPALRLRFTPSNAVRQNWQFTAHPTWLETQIVDRRQPRTRFSTSSPASLPSPLSPSSPSGIQTVSTVSASLSSIR